MAILVTGGAGFIGSHFIERMLAVGRTPIVCLDNFNDYYDPTQKRANIEGFRQHPQVHCLEGSFCDAAFVGRLFAEHSINAVMHLGAYAGVRTSIERPQIYAETNVVGTLVLLEAARRHPVERFVLASSSTVYGQGAVAPFVEDSPLGLPLSPYGATKRSAELLGLLYHQLHGVPVVCVRPFSVYGSRLRPDLALSIFTAAILAGRALPLFGDGSIRRDFTHVSDICAGLHAALDAPQAVGQCINLGHSEPYPMLVLIERLAAALGREAKIEYLPEKPGDMPITHANLDKAARLLGYHPQMSLEDGLREFVAWYRRTHRV
ncbi:MAG: GDP-mannose 4,6-dehydratase [Pirellulales bacterium]|nr:GDP-mannose 4,6-dehydratase [Pirellulales bacterium]